MGYRFKDVFFAENGFGPYPCFFCGEDVTFDEVHVHHADEDQENDSPENLKPVHDGCHKSHHSSRWWATATPEQRAARVLKTNGVNQRVWKCGGCDRVTNAGGLATHQNATGHRGQTRV